MNNKQANKVGPRKPNEQKAAKIIGDYTLTNTILGNG